MHFTQERGRSHQDQQRPDAAYTFYSDCTAYQTADLSYVTTQISKPIMVDTGGNLSQVKTRTLTYTYSCNSSYSNCLYKEVYSLGYNVGLYDWKYYVAQNKKWQLVQESIINNFSLGQSVPMFTCPQHLPITPTRVGTGHAPCQKYSNLPNSNRRSRTTTLVLSSANAQIATAGASAIPGRAPLLQR